MITDLHKHPTLKYADVLRGICEPLSKLKINYFAYVCVDHEGKFSALNNYPEFFEHYLTKRYYNADIHLAKVNQFSNYIILDTLELNGLSKKINQEAAEFYLKHFFTIIERDQHRTHYYHFASSEISQSINQVYLNNLDLLHSFIRHFNHCINASKQLSQAYHMKYPVDQNAPGFSIKNIINAMEMRSDFAHTLHKLERSNIPLSLTPQQYKCVELLCAGLSSKQIAIELMLSRRTVENYLKAVRQRFKCRNSKEIIAKYYANLNAMKNWNF